MTFAAGMFVCYDINYAGWVLGGCLNSILAAATILGACGIFPVPGGVIAFPFALLLSAVHRFDNLTASTTVLVPLTFSGRTCYSLYLVHQLPFKAISTGFSRAGVASDQATLLLTVPTCIAVSVTLSWLFYHLVERRFLNIPKPVLDHVGLRMAPAYSGENR
jgi:peptidoglycan/LPS O-acetylase OafA/YrhL